MSKNKKIIGMEVRGDAMLDTLEIKGDKLVDGEKVRLEPHVRYFVDYSMICCDPRGKEAVICQIRSDSGLNFLANIISLWILGEEGAADLVEVSC